MNVERLVAMANDIAAFFEAESGSQAAGEVCRHLVKFWDPRMREQIVGYVAADGGGLSPVAREAVRLLAAGAVGH
jgi:formate dehydrogenase subunit delta